MPRGKTKSKMSMKARRELAFRRFGQGVGDMEIARELKVTRQTVSNYRRKYEASLQAEASGNAGLLRDVLLNTIKALRELDQIRADAWKQIDQPRKMKIQCPNCEEHWTEEYPVSDRSRVQYQNVLIKAQDMRAKILGVLGVKEEVFIAITQVKVVQDKLLAWMGQHLCAADREALASFMENELSEYLSESAPVRALDAIEADVVEVA